MVIITKEGSKKFANLKDIGSGVLMLERGDKSYVVKIVNFIPLAGGFTMS